MPPRPRLILAACVAIPLLSSGCTYGALATAPSGSSGGAPAAVVVHIQPASTIWERIRKRGVPLGVAYLSHPVIDPDETAPTIENLWPNRGRGLAEVVPASTIAADPERLDGPEGAALPTKVVLLVPEGHPSAFVVRLYQSAFAFQRDAQGALVSGELRRVGQTSRFNDADPNGCAVQFFPQTSSALVWCGDKLAAMRRRIAKVLAQPVG
jgi:hypothetical protein